MDLDALLEAELVNFNEALKERHARKGNQSAAEFLLAELRATILELDPSTDPTSSRFRTAVILLAAGLFVGPRVDLLVEFTGYSVPFVDGVAGRMRVCGLWSDVEVSTEEWLDCSTGVKAIPFFTQCLVARGLVNAARNEDGEMVYSVEPRTKRGQLVN
jgi:hypothetical protein